MTAPDTITITLDTTVAHDVGIAVGTYLWDKRLDAAGRTKDVYNAMATLSSVLWVALGEQEAK
jgi:hypothetical protein